MPQAAIPDEFRYQAWGHLVVSNRLLPELKPAPAHAALPVIRLCFDACSTPWPSPPRWTFSWGWSGDQPWMACAETEGGYLVRFPGRADFLIDRPAETVTCRATKASIPPETLRYLALDQVMPLVFKARGRQALHATAVLTPRGACAFIAPAGTGKSTLSASFLAAGYPTLTDDCLVLELAGDGLPYVLPGYPGVRLWDDSYQALQKINRRDLKRFAHYTSKCRWIAPAHFRGFSGQPVRLARVYRLFRDEPPDSFKAWFSAPPSALIQALTPRQCFMELATATFRIAAGDRAMLLNETRFLAQVARRVAGRALVMPDDLAALPTLCRTILDDLERGGLPAAQAAPAGRPPSRMLKKSFQHPAPSLLSLPEGEKV